MSYARPIPLGAFVTCLWHFLFFQIQGPIPRDKSGICRQLLRLPGGFWGLGKEAGADRQRYTDQQGWNKGSGNVAERGRAARNCGAVSYVFIWYFNGNLPLRKLNMLHYQRIWTVEFHWYQILFQVVNREGQAASHGRDDSRLPPQGKAQRNPEAPGRRPLFKGHNHKHQRLPCPAADAAKFQKSRWC